MESRETFEVKALEVATELDGKRLSEAARVIREGYAETLTYTEGGHREGRQSHRSEPGVAVNEMHRKHMLSHEWCSDLLVDVEIRIAVWAGPGRRRFDAAVRYRNDHPRSHAEVQAYTCHPLDHRRRNTWPRFIWTPPK